MSFKLRIIGDVHGKGGVYANMIGKANAEGLFTLQLGDLGFSNTYHYLLNELRIDTRMNKFFMGNHDDHLAYQYEEELPSLKTFNLGMYGPRNLNGVDFYFLSGAFSIDYKERTPGLDWFRNEELSQDLHPLIIESWKLFKPSIVVTHEVPQGIGHDGILKNPEILRKWGYDPVRFTTRTGELLQDLFDIHQPDLWVFGHYHTKWDKKVNGTQFVCLPELATLDI